MRILLVGKGNNGVYYHRLYVPYQALSREGHEVMSTPVIDDITFEECKLFDVVVFNRNISTKFDPAPIFALLKLAKVKIIMDIDDYWHISSGHPMYHYARKTNFARCCVDQLKYSDYITTTHSYLKNFIVKEGIPKEKVFVCKNAIDPLEGQYKQEFSFNDKLMWQGSATHAMDLELLSNIDQPITLCGYYYSEEWFAMSSKIKHPLKKDHLGMMEYMNHYQDTGISLIPLKDNKFNKFKSELKMIEAGWANKPVIVSKIHPYSIMSNHMINCLEAANADEFKKYTELLLKNKQLQDDLRGKLNEEVKKKYLIETPNQIRRQVLEL